MKFTISTQEFNYLINKIQNIIPQKATSPILNNFLIEAANDELVLTATDLTVSIRCCTDITISEEGSTTLPAKRLAQLIRELSAPSIEFTTNSQEITTIVCGTSRFKLNGMGTTEYPDFPDMSEAQTFQLKQKDLKELLFRTSFAVSKEDTRYVLTGLLMHVSEGQVSFVGTDGKRLACAHTSLATPPEFNTQSVIPLKAIDEVVKCLGDEEGVVDVRIMPDKVGFIANQTLILTKLLSGDYPDVSRVIPEQSPIAVILHRDEIMRLLRQVSLFVVDSHHAVRFTFTPGELKLSANTKDFGEGDVSMPVNYHGDELEIAFNPGYFIDILRHCKEETVTLGLTDGFNPGVIIDGEAAAPLLQRSPLFIIMPMRLSED